eukprot:832365-Prymnesium_polylepis.2
MQTIQQSKCRTVLILTLETQLFPVLDALRAHGLYGDGYAVLTKKLLSYRENLADWPGLLFVQDVDETTARKVSAHVARAHGSLLVLDAAWPIESTLYNASLHGDADVTLYDRTSPHIWNAGAPDMDKWGLLMCNAPGSTEHTPCTCHGLASSIVGDRK